MENLEAYMPAIFGAFDPHWRAGAICDDIRRYAPHFLRDSEGRN